MSSGESVVNVDLILKTEKYDTDGPSTLHSPQPTAFIKSVYPNNNLTVNCKKVQNLNNTNCSLSPKLESYCAPVSPLERMPIPPSANEMQTNVIAGTTPVPQSLSPTLPSLGPIAASAAQQHGATISNGSSPTAERMMNTRRMSSILGGYGLVPSGILGPLDHYRLQLYNYAINVERLRGCGTPQQYPGPLYSAGYPGGPGGPVANGPYAPTRFALSMGLFPNRMFQPEEPKPQHSYIGLIAMAILSSAESKLVLSDIYQHILDNYPYFRTRGPGWRNSIRHNLSLNDCFVKAGRSANGKGHYWAIHPANMEDFRKGDFRRRKAQRKVRKHMGLAVDDEGTDSPSPPPLAVTPPTMPGPPHPGMLLMGSSYTNAHHANHQPYSHPLSSVMIESAANECGPESVKTTAAGVIANLYSQTRKRQFDVASLLAPDDCPQNNHHLPLSNKQRITLTEEEDIDVVASDIEEEQEHKHHIDEEQYTYHRQSNYQQYQDSQSDVNSLFVPSSETSNSRHNYPSSSSPASQFESSSEPAPSQCTSNDNMNLPNWQGLMQNWPNEFGNTAAAAAAAAMDPRIFGRYYSQYMAAAAARRMAGVFPAAAAAAAAAVIGQHHNLTTKQSIGHQPSALLHHHHHDQPQKHHQHQQQLQHHQPRQQPHQQQSYEC